MSPITQTFRRLKKQNQKALIPFITAGDPSLATTYRLILALEKAGADLIELGVPFSDPMADGPVIQKASERSLKKGTTLRRVLDLVKKIRKKTQIPLVLMGYYNPIFVMGHDVFAEQAKSAGVDGVLVVDLPPEESKSLRMVLARHGIDFIPLLAPTSDERRIQKAVQGCRGFIYYVSLTGVTGAKLQISNEIFQKIGCIRQNTSKPIAIGFGISKPADAERLAPLADGFVVGSALVSLIEKHATSSHLEEQVTRFMRSFKR